MATETPAITTSTIVDITRSEPPRAARRAPATAIYLIVALVFTGHLALGANRDSLALGFAAAWFALLAWTLSGASARRSLSGTSAPGLEAILFGLVLLAAVVSLTPFGIGGPNPVWTYVPRAVAIVSIDPYATLLEIVKLLALGAAFMVGRIVGADDERAARLLRALLAAGAFYSAWALIDHASNPDSLFGAPRPFDPTRLSASFGSANTAATLFGALILLGLADCQRTYERVRPRTAFHSSHVQKVLPAMLRPVVTLLLNAACIVETLSRAGTAATAGVAVVLVGALALLGARRSASFIPVIAILFIVIGGMITLGGDELLSRVAFFERDSTSRSHIFAAHWAAFLTAPWSGYGLGSFHHINATIMTASNVGVLDSLGAAHNVYVQWLEEAGLVGALPMFATVAVIGVRLGVGALRRGRMRAWLLAILAVLALFALHGASDYALQTPSMALVLSLVLGVGVSAASAGRSKTSANAPLVVATGRAG